MREVIMRFSCVHPDVELCIKRNKKIIFKKLSIDEVMMLINQCASQTIFSNKINLLSSKRNWNGSRIYSNQARRTYAVCNVQ